MRDMRFRSEFMMIGTTARSSWEEVQEQKYYLLTVSACTQCRLLQKKKSMCNLSLELRRLKERGNGSLEALVQVLPSWTEGRGEIPGWILAEK